MPTTTFDLSEIRIKSLEMLDAAEDFVLGAVDDALEATKDYVPEVDLPLDRVPKASHLVDQAFAFAGDVLSSQREFVGKLLEKAEAFVPSGKTDREPGTAA